MAERQSISTCHDPRPAVLAEQRLNALVDMANSAGLAALSGQQGELRPAPRRRRRMTDHEKISYYYTHGRWEEFKWV
jgi:hypothetical protein